MSIRIVADSSSNLRTLDDIDFTSVPLKIISGDTEYIDNEVLDVAQMVDEMSRSKAKCSTSCPNAYDWEKAYEAEGDIFVITITSRLSGSYSAAKQARDSYMDTHPNKKIRVIDSFSTGPEMELIIEKLREYILEGLSFEEINCKIDEYIKSTHLLVSLQSLDNLAKNGRVSPAVAKIAGVLGIRIVGAAIEGVLKPVHKCRGEKRALETMKEEMLQKGYNGGKLRISHCMNCDSAEAFADMIRTEFKDCDINIRECTGLCSFYAEKGGVIIGFEA